jgi:hypothetical protein
MSKSEKKLPKSIKEVSTLNDYHNKRNKAELKEVESMLKHPYSLEEAKEQTRKFMSVK